jgi:hypothetical protein
MVRMRELLPEMPMLCAKAGMGRSETITLDGMKIGANASGKANRTEEQIEAELAKVARDAVAEHRDTDAAKNALFGPGAPWPHSWPSNTLVARPRRRRRALTKRGAHASCPRRSAVRVIR